MLLKCHSKSCLKLSFIHVSNKDAYCTASNNSFGIISIFPPSLYSDQKIESKEDITTLLEALEFGHNFDELENLCVKVTGSVLQYSDITPSATPGKSCYILAIVTIIVCMGVRTLLEGSDLGSDLDAPCWLQTKAGSYFTAYIM